MDPRLSSQEIIALVRRVFAPRPSEKRLAVLVDLPDRATPDTPAWHARRSMAAEWARTLAAAESETGLATALVLYRNVRHANADLPSVAWLKSGPELEAALPKSAEELDERSARNFREILSLHPIILAPTEFSATAPLKLMARELGLRAATMPGFSAAMIPALRLDYVEINRRVAAMKGLLDRASEAVICFTVDGRRRHELRLDLRHRSGHASGGVLHEPGTAGNLPSGESYIVPYEGEKPGDASRSQGELPVQLGEVVVVYRIVANRAVEVLDPESSEAARREAALLASEPAYGNLAELGLGVLDDFGVQATGELLLDEKLGLHIAFGRSDHFGGQVGAKQFTRPEAVVHIDRVYLPSLQPRVAVSAAELFFDGGERLLLMRDGRYLRDVFASA